MGFAELIRVQNEMVGGREGRPDRGSSSVQNRPVRVPVDSIVLEVFIRASVKLIPVSVVGAIENSAVNHGRGARKIEGGRGSARSRKHLRCRLCNRGRGGVSGGVTGQDLGPQSIGEILLGPICKLGILIGLCAVPGRRGGPQRLDRKEEEKLVARNDRPADRSAPPV